MSFRSDVGDIYIYIHIFIFLYTNVKFAWTCGVCGVGKKNTVISFAVYVFCNFKLKKSIQGCYPIECVFNVETSLRIQKYMIFSHYNWDDRLCNNKKTSHRTTSDEAFNSYLLYLHFVGRSDTWFYDNDEIIFLTTRSSVVPQKKNTRQVQSWDM